jgi:hypothetical protein
VTHLVDAAPSRAVLATLDPALGDLRGVLDPALVSRRFEQHWPGDAGRAPTVIACVLEDAKWTPATSCVATFRLGLGPTPASSTIGVVEVGPAGVHYRLFDEDARLAGLSAAADPRAVGPALADALARPVDTCRVVPIRYRAGERCVLRYELAHRSSREVVFGKVTPAAARLAATFDGILAAGPADAEPLVPPVRAVLPALDLLVQADGGPETLARVADMPLSTHQLQLLRRAGVLLAALHGLTGPPGAWRTLGDDATTLEAEVTAARHADPRTADRILAAVQRLRALAGDTTARPVPTHGAFRLDQIAVREARPQLIDLDGYCWAEPSRDLGNLRAYLRWKAMRRRAFAAATRLAIEAGYERQWGAPIDSARVGLHEAASLLKIAVRRYQNLSLNEWPLVPGLVDRALQLLGPDAGARS